MAMYLWILPMSQRRRLGHPGGGLGVASVVLSIALVEYWKTFPPPDVKMDPTGQMNADTASMDVELSLKVSRKPNESTELLHNQESSSSISILASYDDCHIFTSP